MPPCAKRIPLKWKSCKGPMACVYELIPVTAPLFRPLPGGFLTVSRSRCCERASAEDFDHSFPRQPRRRRRGGRVGLRGSGAESASPPARGNALPSFRIHLRIITWAFAGVKLGVGKPGVDARSSLPVRGFLAKQTGPRMAGSRRTGRGSQSLMMQASSTRSVSPVFSTPWPWPEKVAMQSPAVMSNRPSSSCTRPLPSMK